MTEDLNRHGLFKVGRWVVSNHMSVKHLRDVCPTGINYEISQEWRKKRDVVYALVINAAVRYVGETSIGMAARFNGYRYGNPLESDTDNRIKLAITNALVKEVDVEVWACCPLAELKLANGLMLQVPASKPLEEHLIGLMKPDLNMKNLRMVSIKR